MSARRTPAAIDHHDRHVDHVRRERLRGLAHLLRLDRKHDDVGAVDGAGGRLAEDADARKQSDQLVLLRRQRLDHAEFARVGAAVDESADESRWPCCRRR